MLLMLLKLLVFKEVSLTDVQLKFLNMKLLTKVSLSVIILLSTSFMHIDRSDEIDRLTSQLEKANKRANSLSSDKYLFVIGTKYNSDPAQCWGDHTITADNSKIDLRKLAKHELKWVAISRDLRKHFNFGDTIIVEGGIPKLNGEWVVKDLMNKRYTSRIDFLVPKKDKYDFNQPSAFRIKKKQ